MSAPEQRPQDHPPVRTEVRGAVLVVVLDRPVARNAVDAATALAVDAALTRLEDDDALRVGVLTGAGGVFSAGMDLKARARGESPVLPSTGFAGLTRRRRSKPLVAAVEGWALGGGTELVLACDVVVASREARFGLPEVTRGIVAPQGGLVRLPRRIPRAVAAELLLTGAPLGAERAEQLGLVSRLTEPGGALAAALEVAERVVAAAPLAVAAVKRVLDETADLPEAEAFAQQDALVANVLRSADAAEGRGRSPSAAPRTGRAADSGLGTTTSAHRAQRLDERLGRR